MANLLSEFNKRGIRHGLDTLQVDIEDTSYLSTFFVISEFNPLFTAGKNSVSFNGSNLLKEGSEILVECIDSNGNALYIEEPRSNVIYWDISKFLVSIHVYNETYNGTGKLILVGTTPKGEIVRWVADISIDKTLQNTSKVRFYNKPILETKGILYPVIANDVAVLLTKTITVTGSFYTLPVDPPKDTDSKTINTKKKEIDYRVIFNHAPANYLLPSISPTRSFNTQMEGQSITLMASRIQLPYSYVESEVNLTSSFTIKKVLDNKTIQINEPFFYTYGKDKVTSHIMDGIFTSTYVWVGYNTSSDAYQTFVTNATRASTRIQVKVLYAEMVYRNLTTFSGFIARHKLYKKSKVSNGEFELIVDEPLAASELLIDNITNNKSYALLGKFYNKSHIENYWYTSSNSIELVPIVSPRIDSMKILSSNHLNVNNYAIVKLNSTKNNTAEYIPYDITLQSSKSMDSNFINLKSGAQYALTTEIILDNPSLLSGAKVEFYFTSSFEKIKLERGYIGKFGLKIGEIVAGEITKTKIFTDRQTLFFTPSNDYYGTVVIIPHHCDVTLSNMSLKIYGDYGFSPDVLSTIIPFPISVAGEAFELKAELFDINSTLVYSDLHTVHIFDTAGTSLSGNPINSYAPVTIDTAQGSFTVTNNLYAPNLSSCNIPNTRLIAYHIPSNTPPDPTKGDGEMCYTNIASLGADNNYINIETVTGNITTPVQSIAIKYTGSGAPGGAYGRRIVISSNGTKTEYS